MKLSFTVPEGPDRKAYHILRRELLASSALVRRLKVADAIRVDGAPVFTDYMLRPGQTLTADLDACEPVSDLIPQEGPLSILWEEEGFLAVNKPAGLLIHPTHSKNTGTLCNLAAGYLAAKGEGGGIHAVNRLDRDTGGVVLLAKNSHMKALLCDILALPSAEKNYLALVYGSMPEARGVIDAPIARVNGTDLRREVRSDGRKAVTRYQVLGEAEGVSLLSLTLETGRTHQIRVHCAHLGCPLLGDRLYGSEASLALSQRLGADSQLLHACRLTFCHPYTKEQLTLTAPIQRVCYKNILENLKLPIDF